MKPIPCGLASDAAATVLDEAARRRWLQQLEDDRSRFLLRHPFTASLTLHLAVELVTDPRLPPPPPMAAGSTSTRISWPRWMPSSACS